MAEEIEVRCGRKQARPGARWAIASCDGVGGGADDGRHDEGREAPARRVVRSHGAGAGRSAAARVALQPTADSTRFRGRGSNRYLKALDRCRSMSQAFAHADRILQTRLDGETFDGARGQSASCALDPEACGCHLRRGRGTWRSAPLSQSRHCSANRSRVMPAGRRATQPAHLRTCRIMRASTDLNLICMDGRRPLILALNAVSAGLLLQQPELRWDQSEITP